MAEIHIFLDNTPGVGNTSIASLLIQHQLNKGKNVLAIDAAATCANFIGYKSLNVEHFNMRDDNGGIDIARFDQLFAMINDANVDSVVIDTDSSTSLALTPYLINNDIVNVLEKQGHHVIINSVVSPFRQTESLWSFSNVCDNFGSKNPNVIVWLNEYKEEIQHKGKRFEEFKVYRNNEEKIKSIITLGKQTYYKDIELMREKGFTFDEAINSEEFSLIPTQRLKKLKAECYEALDVAI